MWLHRLLGVDSGSGGEGMYIYICGYIDCWVLTVVVVVKVCIYIYMWLHRLLGVDSGSGGEGMYIYIYVVTSTAGCWTVVVVVKVCIYIYIYMWLHQLLGVGQW